MKTFTIGGCKGMAITARETKALMIEVLTCLIEHPEINYKGHLPQELWSKIKEMELTCPLCEFTAANYSHDCWPCPLKPCDRTSPYGRWTHATTSRTRKAAARAALNIVQAWDVEGL